MLKSFSVIAIIFLAGCALHPKDLPSLKEKDISRQDWERVLPLLQEAPQEVRAGLQEEAAPRLVNRYAAPKQPQEIIEELAARAKHPQLTLDNDFARTELAVSGYQLGQQAYARMMADYLATPDFNCRHPVYAYYLQRRYSVVAKTGQCSAELPFAILTHHEGVQLRWVNISRVKEIHLLFASNSQSMASRFGHVALRLVICPEGKFTAEQCDSNLSEHIVLGFRAHIDELSLDSIKALTGKYRAYLFAHPFIDVYKEYAIDEFRDVYSLPMHLNNAQKERLLRGLADVHWRFSGEYSFFSNNCATILQRALQNLLPELLEDPKLVKTYLRPDHYFEAIKASTWSEGVKLIDLERAERDGFFFSSTKAYYEQALQEVRNAMSRPVFKDIQDYIEIIPSERKRLRNEDLQYVERLARDKHLREAQLMLEEYSFLISERLMMIEGARYVEQQDLLNKSNQFYSKLDKEHAQMFESCLLGPIRLYSRPILRTDGIPAKTSMPDLPKPMEICQSTEGKRLLREAIKMVMDTESEEWKQLNLTAQYWVDTIANLTELKGI